MLTLSRDRLKRFPVAQFVNANFKAPGWTDALNPPYAAVIAMQAVHEIRHKRLVPGLYLQLRQVLSPGGMVAVCDGTPGESPVLCDKAIGSMILVAGRVSG